MPDQPHQPQRRRITDRDRRRWNDQALDMLREDVDDLKTDVRADLADIRTDIRELREEDRRHFQRNFEEHKAVQATADGIAKSVKPTRMDKAKDMALILSLLLMPILTTYGLSH